MADLDKILKRALEVAQKVAPLTGGSGTTAVAAAQAVQALLKALKGAGSAADDTAIDQQLATLQQQVNQETDDFIALARGQGGGAGGSGGGDET